MDSINKPNNTTTATKPLHDLEKIFKNTFKDANSIEGYAEENWVALTPWHAVRMYKARTPRSEYKVQVIYNRGVKDRRRKDRETRRIVLQTANRTKALEAAIKAIRGLQNGF